MCVIVWHRFSMLECRLRSIATVSLARTNNNKEIKKKINILMLGENILGLILIGGK